METDSDFEIEDLEPYITMLGKRKYTATRESRKKTRGFRRRVSNMMLTREVKYYETGFNIASVTNTPQVFALSDIAQGDNYNNRNGNLVQSKYLQWEFTMNQVANTIPINYKIALVLDRAPNGISPTFQNVFDTSVAPLTFSMKNIQAFQERFKILREYLGVCTSSHGGDATQSCFKGFVDMRKLPAADQIVRWSGSGAVAPNVNGLYLMIVTSTSTVNEVIFRGTVRYAFNEN